MKNYLKNKDEYTLNAALILDRQRWELSRNNCLG